MWNFLKDNWKKARGKLTKKLNFYRGESEKLNEVQEIHEESVDVVINVESSHCYGNFKEFVKQVDRVLKPGGLKIIFIELFIFYEC